MRIIECKMIQAVKAGKNWSNGNTCVKPGLLGAMGVYLHGNLIAFVSPTELRVTLAGWPTVTTRSRVNALLRELAAPGYGVGQRNGRQWLTNSGWMKAAREIGANEWVQNIPRSAS